jgi:hypothetical protein
LAHIALGIGLSLILTLEGSSWFSGSQLSKKRVKGKLKHVSGESSKDVDL